MTELVAGSPRELRVRIATGLRLHVLEWGAADGWPLVILHGGAHDASCWAAVCRRLPPELRSIVPDQRGHGESDRAPDGDYSCPAQVDDLVALLDALGVDRCALVGAFHGRAQRAAVRGQLARAGDGARPRRRRHRDAARRGWRPSAAAASAAMPRRTLDRPSAVPSPAFDVRLLDFVPTYGGDAEERRRLLAAGRRRRCW